MARFTDNLTDPSFTPVSPEVDSGVSPEANVITSAGNLAGAGLQLFEQIQQRREGERQQQVLGDVTTELLNLEDKRNALLQSERNYIGQVTDIYKDGQVTEEEQQTLQALERQKNKLERARRSGVLNPMSLQTRMNALHKQALADTRNLAIQDQINALFQQGRSRVKGAEDTLAQQQIQSAMDNKYGTGNWTATDFAREQADSIYMQGLIQQGQQNVTSIRTELPYAFQRGAEGAIRQLRQQIQAKAGLTDDSSQLFKTQINTLYQQARTQVLEMVKVNRESGIPISQEDVKGMLDDLEKQHNVYTSMLSKEGEFGDTASLLRRMDNAVKLMENVQKLRSGPAASAVSSVLSGGSNGDVLALATLMDTPDSTLQSVINNLPPALRDATSVAQLKQNMAVAVNAQLNGTTLQQLIDMGAVNPGLGQYVASKQLSLTDSPETMDSSLEVFQQSATSYENMVPALERLSSPDVQANFNKSDPATKKIIGQRTTAIANDMVEQIRQNISLLNNPAIKVVDGKLQAEVPEGRNTGSIFGAGMRTQRIERVKYLNKILDSYSKFLKANKQFVGDSQQYYDAILATEEELQQEEAVQ